MLVVIVRIADFCFQHIEQLLGLRSQTTVQFF